MTIEQNYLIDGYTYFNHQAIVCTKSIRTYRNVKFVVEMLSSWSKCEISDQYFQRR